MSVPLTELAEGYTGEAFTDAKTCPICAAASKVRHPAHNIHPDKPHAFDFRVCDACGHGWIDPMPSQGLLSHLYGIGSRSVIGEWGESPLTIPERVCRDRELARPPGTYLELGVGQGHLYRLFVDRGWRCTGVDPGDWSSPFPNVVRDLSEVPTDLSADVVAAFDVLEHVAQPIEILRSLRKLAAPAARLYCAMPNRESRRAARHRDKWRMMRPIGHVNYYSRRSITLALKTAGFEVKYIRATDLNERKFPTRRSELRPALIEWLGQGDQWVVMARAV